MNVKALRDALPRNPRGVFVQQGTESQEQASLMQWLASISGIDRRLRAAYAVPNSSRRTRSGRASNAVPGLSPGVPDVCIPVRSGRFGSLYIELKVEDNDTSDVQDDWLRRLDAAGNAVTVAYGWCQAAAFVVEYLTDPESFVSGP